MRKRWAHLTAATLAAALAGTGLSTPALANPGPKKVISYAGFTGATGLHLVGSAGIHGDSLRLTSDTKRLAGAAWARPKINAKQSFETAFDLEMTGEVGHADGVAFVLQNDGRAEMGGYGGSIGYGGMTHSVAIEFDTFKNPEDVDNNHIAVVTGGASDAAQPIVAPSPIMMFGQAIRVRITWLADTRTLKVRVKAAGSDQEIKVLDRKFDLRQALGWTKAFAGFTGGTGEDVSVQEINNWSVKVW
ncbi:L-type lectin-domain containing protein [Actinoplanes sp. N902-109]|uniref:L-type lectin-domain containing protein n=1 Tax=Actinoplanes sp. (strain N902-109) TaxID=649831 RepID=UPI000329341F|nr:L-type lectin-domain containing protein [Actinoplanes sp. N902-109]AGL20818.1 protein kinase [Actinoplanes sp. N902-109]